VKDGSSNAPLLGCKGLEVGYRGHAILPPFDLEIRPGEFWVVIGKNGAGKSTWFKTMLGMLPVISGKVERRPDARISYVPQRASLDPLFPLAARDVVAMGAFRGRGFLGLPFREPSVVAKALKEVDALDLADRAFRDLSEGQKARVLLARLVASQPDLALLDEPTAAMDVVAERRAFEYLDELRERDDTAIVVVSHYLGLAKKFATHAVFLDRDCECVVAGSPAEVFAHTDFHRSYGADHPDVLEGGHGHGEGVEHGHGHGQGSAGDG
jgi:zinc transport system ATP-binding protein